MYKKTLRPEIIQNWQSSWAYSFSKYNKIKLKWSELNLIEKKIWNKITQDHGEKKILRSEITQDHGEKRHLDLKQFTFDNVLEHVLFWYMFK